MKRQIIYFGAFLLLVLVHFSSCSENKAGETDPTPTPTPNATTTFTRTYGGEFHEFGYSIDKTEEGGYVLCGDTVNIYETPVQILVIKIDEFGDEEWSGIYGYEASPTRILQTHDKGYIIVGYTQTYSNDYECNVFLLKLSHNGDMEWLKHFNEENNIDESCASILQNEDGSYVLGGTKDIFENGEYVGYIYLMKVSNNGELIWDKVIAEKWSYAGSMQNVKNDGYIIGGVYDYGILLIRTDSEGNVLWKRKFGRTYDSCLDIQITSDDGYILCGSRENYPSPYSILLYKTTSEGEVEWERTHVGPDLGFHYYPLSMKITPDQGYIFCGFTGATHPSGPNSNIFIFKTDNLGNALWFKKFGGRKSEIGYEIQIANDNGLIFLGYTYSYGAGNSDFYLIKTDENGEF